MAFQCESNTLPVHHWCNVLELPQRNPHGLSALQLKTQYKKMALKYHPDKKPHGNDRKFQQISHAYTSLAEYVKSNPASVFTLDPSHTPLTNVLQDILSKYNVNININVHNVQSVLSTINIDQLFMTFQDMFNPAHYPTESTSHVSRPENPTKSTSPVSLPNNHVQMNPSIEPEQHNINVSLQDIYDDLILMVVIKTNNHCYQFKVPALYESITFEDNCESPVTIQLELVNDTIFEIYNETNLCIVHNVTVAEYFTKIEYSFAHMDGSAVHVNLTNPHCNCRHYLDGVYCKYNSLGLPVEHKSPHRGDLYVFFNVRADLENYIQDFC